MLSGAMEIGRKLAEKWTNWRAHREQLAELASCDAAEVDRMARELGFTSDELKLLASRGPAAADLLYRRLAELGLNAKEIEASVPEVMRDMQRCCTECEAKRRCASDFAHDVSARWPEYCPNAETIALLRVIGQH
jgi:hypothetical protein